MSNVIAVQALSPLTCTYVFEDFRDGAYMKLCDVSELGAVCKTCCFPPGDHERRRKRNVRLLSPKKSQAKQAAEKFHKDVDDLMKEVANQIQAEKLGQLRKQFGNVFPRC